MLKVILFSALIVAFLFREQLIPRAREVIAFIRDRASL